jgi:hypothetical protein
MLVSSVYLKLALCHSGALNFDMCEKFVHPCVTVFRIFLWDVNRKFIVHNSALKGFESPFLLDEYLYERWYIAFGRQVCKVLYRTAGEGDNCEYP